MSCAIGLQIHEAPPAAPLERRDVFGIETQLVFAVQGLQNRPAGDQKIHRRREADFFGGVLLDGARDFHHVGDRLYRGVESKVFGLLHLARVNIDIAEAAFFVGTPILAVAKNGHEIAEGDDLVISSAVVELARVVFHRLGKVDFADLFAVEQKLGLTVHRRR